MDIPCLQMPQVGYVQKHFGLKALPQNPAVVAQETQMVHHGFPLQSSYCLLVYLFFHYQAS
jgi:hypothetical protein